jgi:hypothetical protein
LLKVHGTRIFRQKVELMSLLERHGEVKTGVVPDTKRCTLQVEVRENVEPSSEVYTDALS